MDGGYRAFGFDELEDVPWKPGLTLRPVRSQLGLRAFGPRLRRPLPGDLVVEPHTEREGRGRSRGNARRGRAARPPRGRATEPDTAVLALGGPPTFEPAGHEYMARVRGAVDRPETALARVPELRDEARNDSLLA